MPNFRNGGHFIPRVDLRLNCDGGTVTFRDIASLKNGHLPEGYSIKVRSNRKDVIEFVLRRTDGKVMDVDYLDVLFTVPLLNFSRIILPDCGREYILRDKALYLRSLVTGVTAPNDGHPFAALLGQTGDLVSSFGLLSFLRESTCRCLDPLLSRRKALRGGHDILTLGFRMPSEGWKYGRTTSVRETVFLGSPDRSWYDSLRRYAAIGKKMHRTSYPENKFAWDPVWCTWTAWPSDIMNEKLVMDNARMAAKLGMKTVILDDGWFGPGLDTDTAPLNIGDYYPDPAKFADMPGTVRKLQNLGLRVLLWYAPTCISPDSKAFASRRHLLISHQKKPVFAPNGFYNLCPCNPEVRAYVRGEISRMMREYGPDGFKVDLYNTLPATACDADHPHDVESMIEAVHMMMDDIWTVTRRAKPGALLELKQNYGNLLAAQYGTMVRAGDTAYDSDSNLWRCFYIQAYAPVTHNDYLACSTYDSPRDIAVMMIKQLLGGVPTFSLDLPRQPKETVKTIGAWLDFYRNNLSLWRLPREPQTSAMDSWQILSEDKAIVCALFSSCEITVPQRPSVFILNATGREELYLRTSQPGIWHIRRFNHAHRMTGGKKIELNDGDSVAIPSGGGAVLQHMGIK